MPISKKERKTANENTSGSLHYSEPEFLAVGKLGKTHGLQGEMWMNLLTDFPERLIAGKQIFLGPRHFPCVIRTFKNYDKRSLISFEGIHTPEETLEMRNQFIYVRAAQLPELTEGDYYHHELIGMKVFDEKRQLIGTLVEIIETGANDVYVIRSKEEGEREILVPAIDDVVLHVEPEDRTMVVKLQEWV